MQVQTFEGKASIEGIKQMDEHINEWLHKNKIEPKFVNQVFGSERHAQHVEPDPVIITSIWY